MHLEVLYEYMHETGTLFSFSSLIYLTYSRWTSSLPSCLWSQRIFPSLPGSRLTFFYRYASSALLQLVNQWLNFTYSRCPGLPASSLPVCPVYRCFFFVPPRHPGLPVVCRYTGVVHFFMLAEPLLLLHTPTHAAAAYHLRKAKMDFIHARSSKPAVQADIRAMFSDS